MHTENSSQSYRQLFMIWNHMSRLASIWSPWARQWIPDIHLQMQRSAADPLQPDIPAKKWEDQTDNFPTGINNIPHYIEEEKNVSAKLDPLGISSNWKKISI